PSEISGVRFLENSATDFEKHCWSGHIYRIELFEFERLKDPCRRGVPRAGFSLRGYHAGRPVGEMGFEVERAILIFDQGGTVFDPVAGIQIGQVTEVCHVGSMDMTADDSVAPALASMAEQITLELAHETNRRFHFILDSAHMA